MPYGRYWNILERSSEQRESDKEIKLNTLNVDGPA